MKTTLLSLLCLMALVSCSSPTKINPPTERHVAQVDAVDPGHVGDRPESRYVKFTRNSSYAGKGYLCEFELSREGFLKTSYTNVTRTSLFVKHNQLGGLVSPLYEKDDLSLNISGEIDASGALEFDVYIYNKAKHVKDTIAENMVIKGSGIHALRFDHFADEPKIEYLLVAKCTKSNFSVSRVEPVIP